ncbi:MAG: type II toxin-antitoxin system RatA family toxin [Hyphomicrobium sp.]
MPHFTTRRRVTFTAAQMFALVADVERYPEFLPLCESLVVTSRESRGTDTVLIATMGIGYKAIRERFTTRVTLQPDAHTILVEYLDGPFKRLENRWRLIDMPGGSEVDFFIDYEFRSIALGLLMGAMFDTAFRRFAEAFEARARTVYGRPLRA